MKSAPPGTFRLDGTPLKASERGLVIGEPSIPSKPGTVVHDRRLNSQSLRFNLLFWDRLEEPLDFDDAIGLVGNTRQFLLSEGIMQKSYVETPPGADFLERHSAHLQVYRKFDARDGGRWSFARHERSTRTLPIEEVEQDRGILLKLYQVIPIPHRDVPLADVLEFKTKRQPELLNLRYHLERLYQSIIASPDLELAKTTELAALDNAITAHIRTSKESKFRLVLSGFQAKLNLPISGAITAVALSQAGLSVSHSFLTGLGAAATAYLATVSLNITAGLRDRKSSSIPFEYVAMIDRQLFL